MSKQEKKPPKEQKPQKEQKAKKGADAAPAADAPKAAKPKKLEGPSRLHMRYGKEVIPAITDNTFTSGLYVGMFGDFANYWTCDALDMQVQVLTELYAETNQDGFILRYEGDGAPALSEAFARVKLG